jgi:hypothetical protein
MFLPFKPQNFPVFIPIPSHSHPINSPSPMTQSPTIPHRNLITLNSCLSEPMTFRLVVSSQKANGKQKSVRSSSQLASLSVFLFRNRRPHHIDFRFGELLNEGRRGGEFSFLAIDIFRR